MGETQQSLKARMSQHRKPSTSDTVPDSAVFSHLVAANHHFNIKDVKILDREKRWFDRGVKESIWERVEEPSLNKKGGLRFNLSHNWDRAVRKIAPKLRATEPRDRDVTTQPHDYIRTKQTGNHRQ